MVRVAAGLRVKSPGSAFAPGAAATVTVVGSLDGCDSVAVTVATPPFSAIDDGDTDSTASGASSSSVMASVAPVTVPAPWPLASVAPTVTVRSGASVGCPRQ